MKKSKLIGIILVMVISFSILLGTNETLAANNMIDITNTITGSGNNTVSNNTVNNTVNNTIDNNVANNTANNSIANNEASNVNNTVLTTNNTSNYNNSSLPDTGIESSLPGIIFVIILGISAIYAYNKIQYYKNI